MGYKASDGRTYSSAAAASRANSRMASAPNIGGSSSSSSSSTSKGGSSSSSRGGTYKYNPTTGYYERTDGGTNTYTGKGGSTVTVGGGKVSTTGGSGSSRTITGGHMQNGKLYNEYSDGTIGLASESGGAGSKGNTSKLSSNISSNSNVGEKKKEDYTSSSRENYTNAYNHYKEQGMSDADARTQASAFLENENLLGGNKKENAPIIENNEEEERDPMDTMNEVFYEDEEPYDYHQSQEWQDLMGEIDYYKDYANNLASQLESNTVKTFIPEERDTSYDYNTYYKENLAPDNNYENGESKNTLNDKPQTTLVSQYQEPVTTALNDLGLLTPNEKASTDMPNTEEQPEAPKTYTSGEEIISEFNDTLNNMGQEGGTGLAPQSVAQTYMEYKKKLDDYVNNNRLSAEEADALLSQLKSNETLNNILRK